jgi:diguanylate cyclase (GGDEF)-like protein
VSSAGAANRAKALARQVNRPAAILWTVYALLGVLVVAYLLSLIFRGPDQSWPLVDDWMTAGFELIAGALCLARAVSRRRGRAIPLVLGAAALSWAVGDVLLAVESLGGATPSTPSLADVFFLGFYPLAYVALVLLLRWEVREFIPATWLDGVVAGLGAAALCAAFAFNAILRSLGGDPLAVATSLAYPIGDVLLLGLAVGGTAILPRRRPAWLLLAVACGINAVGDTFALFNSTGAGSHVGTIADGIAWPAAILLMSMSVWLRRGHSDPLASPRPPGFLLPGIGALSSLAILFIGTMYRVEQIAIGLATATLITVGIRLALSVRRLRGLTEQRQRQAVTDELTGLGNRRQLVHVLSTFFADHAEPGTAGRRLAFLYVDLDHFKEINDSFGHAAGDDLLKQVGPRLTGLLRGSDLLVRLGGDELGVLLLDTDPNYAATVARRLLAGLEAPFVLGAVSVRISASIGIAIAPTDATDTAGLLRCADLAMYRAKARKSSVEIYQQDLHVGGNRLLLVEELRAAVEANQFVLHYQPMVDLPTGEISSFEALLRWPHPKLGMIPPLEFLPLAEEVGLMDALTELVLDQALAQCATWRTLSPGLTVSVNVSATNLLDPGFIELVGARLTRHSLPAGALILEITETTVIREFERCKRVIAQLSDLGLAVSIDDFGAGFTSLAYLGSLAVSEIKLDRAFIAGLTAADRGRQLVRATIDLGHALGLRVVAEGIEDRATLELLTSIGCDIGQGYFISRPKPAEDIAFQSGFGSDVETAAGSKAS